MIFTYIAYCLSGGEIMAMFEYTTKVEILKALIEILKELKAIRKAMETKKN